MRFPGTYSRSLFESVNHHPVTQLVSSLMGGGASSTPAAPVATPAPPAPTVDQATVDTQQAAQSSQSQGQKKGALSTLLNTGNTETGAELGAGAQESTLKRFLGS